MADTATDYLLQAVTGALEGFNQARVPYNKMMTEDVFARRRRQEELQQELNLYKQKQPIDIATKQAESGIAIKQAGEEAMAKVPAATAVEVQKDRQTGKEFTPATQKQLELQPDQSYRISEVIAALNAFDKKQGHAESMDQQKKLLDERLNNQNNINALNQTNKVRLGFQTYKGNHPLTSHLPWAPSESDFTGDVPALVPPAIQSHSGVTSNGRKFKVIQ